MDKRLNGLAGAMRHIADQRDGQLRKAGEMSAERGRQLNAFLAAQLPVETALFAAARRRDESLTLAEPTLSAAVHAGLTAQARSVRTIAWPGAYRTAAAVAAAFVIAYTALYSFRPSKPAPRIASDSRLVSFANPDPADFSNVSIFERPTAKLTSRPKRLELASLERSLLTINRSFPELERADRALPLDLPIRHIQLDVEALGTP